MSRISVREATPEHEKQLYNYNFKDKWDRELATAGMTSSLEPPDVEGSRRQSRKKSTNSQEDSAWGEYYRKYLPTIIDDIALVAGSKYDRVDPDTNQYSGYSRDQDQDEDSYRNTGGKGVAWVV